MKVQNPWMGRTQKQAGGMVGYTLYGHNIMRAKPFEVRNPRTPAQQLQRARFTGLTKSANSLTADAINLLFPDTPVGRGRRSEFQHQLAVAFSAAVSQGEYVAQFDPTAIEEIGNGEIGYIGDMVEGAAAGVSGSSKIEGANFSTLKSQMVVNDNTMNVFIVACDGSNGTFKIVDTDMTFTEFDELDSYDIDDITVGAKAYAYAFVGRKLQLIGLGTFSVADRAARKSHNP